MRTIMERSAPESWTRELVNLIGGLPRREALPILREKWEDYTLLDAIAGVLAKAGDSTDRERLVEAIASVDAEVVRRVALALERMKRRATPEELGAGILALRMHEQAGKTADALGALLRRWSGVEVTPPSAYSSWRDWYGKTHPEAAARFADFGSEDWEDRLRKVDWSAGDPAPGKIVFEKLACARCHTGSRRFGPSLKGIASRFSREDLFAHIVNPSSSISPAYKATRIDTRDGEVYQGIPIYDSPAGIILAVGSGRTVRLTGKEILFRKPATLSSMPEGLLAGSSDRELADLYAYLTSLR